MGAVWLERYNLLCHVLFSVSDKCSAPVSLIIKVGVISCMQACVQGMDNITAIKGLVKDASQVLALEY